MFADLIADHATDGCATDRAYSVAARDGRARCSADPCADRSVTLPRRHAGASGEARYKASGNQCAR